MKKFFASLAGSFVLFTLPVNALPIWAEAVAQSHCEYLAIGADWDSALRQAFRDKSHWLDDIARAGDLGARAIGVAIVMRCKSLNDKAFAKKQSQGSI